MRFRMTRVAGALVTDYERELLAELAAGTDWMVGVGDTAQSLAVNVGPDGWTVLRRLTSLEMRGLVKRYDHPSGVLAWRLTDGARAALRAAA